MINQGFVDRPLAAIAIQEEVVVTTSHRTIRDTSVEVRAVVALSRSQVNAQSRPTFNLLELNRRKTFRPAS